MCLLTEEQCCVFYLGEQRSSRNVLEHNNVATLSRFNDTCCKILTFGSRVFWLCEVCSTDSSQDLSQWIQEVSIQTTTVYPSHHVTGQSKGNGRSQRQCFPKDLPSANSYSLFDKLGSSMLRNNLKLAWCTTVKSCRRWFAWVFYTLTAQTHFVTNSKKPSPIEWFCYLLSLQRLSNSLQNFPFSRYRKWEDILSNSKKKKPVHLLSLLRKGSLTDHFIL